MAGWLAAGSLKEQSMSLLHPPIRRTSPVSPRLVTAFGLLALCGAAEQLHAQSPAQAPVAAQTPAMLSVTFDVASIKRNKQAEADRAAIPPNVTVYAQRSQTLPGGRFLGRGMSARELIRDAYGYRNRPESDIVGAPRWIDEERYDVEAKADVEFPLSTSVGLPPAGQAALRALLAERFNLRVRVEVQRRPVYELVMQHADGRLGPNLRPSKGGCVSFFEREPVNVGMVIAKPSPEIGRASCRERGEISV